MGSQGLLLLMELKFLIMMTRPQNITFACHYNFTVESNKNCQGQAYDTTASMSSSTSGAQAHIKENVPDTEFQGCCLHSLNLEIRMSFLKNSSCKIMIDNCQQHSYTFTILQRNLNT